ncbi:MAG: hypothetical protein LBG80_01380 [Bacteroidales bacterium]|jgi:hypothetical protein|nr:hypothetical protein [Bacteroidales bacterium]
MIIVFSREGDQSISAVVDWLMYAEQIITRIIVKDKLNDIKIFTDETSNFNCIVRFGKKQIDFKETS